MVTTKMGRVPHGTQDFDQRTPCVVLRTRIGLGRVGKRSQGHDEEDLSGTAPCSLGPGEDDTLVGLVWTRSGNWTE
jgi:hypothetical protein